MKPLLSHSSIAACAIGAYAAVVATGLATNALSWPPDVAAAISAAIHLAAIVAAVTCAIVQRWLSDLDRYQQVSRNSFALWKQWRRAVKDDDIVAQLGIEEMVRRGLDQ